MNIISDRHLVELQDESAISPDVLYERGYFTAYSASDLPSEFAHYQRRPGLVIPIRDVDGQIAAWQLKADSPRQDKDDKTIKYDTAVGGHQCLDIPQRCLEMLGDPSIPLWITEGAKKVDSAISHGVPCIIGVQGVYGWRGSNANGGLNALSDWENIALNGRKVVLAFDSDVMSKASVRDALVRLSAFLKRRKATVKYLLLPEPEGGRSQETMVATPKCGLDDFFAQGGSLEDAKNLIVDNLPTSEPEWAMPLPLLDSVGPPFPLHALSGVLGEMVAAVSEETQTPLDMAATVGLSTISAAAGGKYQVLMAEQGWDEPVHIMTLVVAEPGTRKSSVIRKMTLPVVQYEREVQASQRNELARWESKHRVLEKQLSTAESTASSSTKDAESINDADLVRMAAVEELDEHRRKRPRVTRIIMDDATPEAVKSMMAEQGGAIAVMSAESAFLSNTAGGRYAANGEPNIDVILNGHAGDAITVDRKGRPNESIERACLTLCCMVQPSVVQKLGRSSGFVTRGGSARLLPSIPADIVGRRRIDVMPVPDITSSDWNVAVRRIAARSPDLSNGCYIPWSLQLSLEAAQLFRSFRQQHEPKMSSQGSYADIRDWAGKQPGAVLRIAGLLHILEYDPPEVEPIGLRTLQTAIQIMDYYAEHARAMYRLLRGESTVDSAQVVLGAIKKLGSPTTKREVHRALHNRAAFVKATDLEEPLQLLEDYGHISRDRGSGIGKSGRPSEVIVLNPLAMDDKTDRSPMNSYSHDDSVGFVAGFDDQDNEQVKKPKALPSLEMNDQRKMHWGAQI